MSDATDKLNELREADRRPSQDDSDLYNHLEREIKKREQYQSFLEHPVTKEIVLKILDWIKYANDLLLAGKGDANTIIRRDNLLDVLGVFSPMKSKTDGIVKSLDSKIKEFNDYYGIKT